MRATPPATLQIDTPARTDRDGFVFISYKNEEASVAEKIRDALKRAGFAVWWDRQIQCGQVWSQALDAAVKQAGCIVVLWSPLATRSRWVVHEASVALARDNYAPARIDLCPIPSPYDQVQATDIINWDGSEDHPGVKTLVARCAALMPLRRSRLRRITAATWARRWLVVAVVFGLMSTSILTWQTIAGQSQLEQLGRVADKLDIFQTQVSKDFLPRLEQLDDVAERQAATVGQLDQFGAQIERKILPQLQQLDSLASRQAESAARLSQSQAELDRSIVRGYYTIEPLIIEFTLKYTFASVQLAPYVERLDRDSDFRRYLKAPDVLFNLKHPDFARLLPQNTDAERPAAELLLSDETSLEFVDLKEQKDPNSRSFIRRYTPDRGVVRFSSYPQLLTGVIVTLPRKGEVEQEIDLYFDPRERVFVKTVRCKNPVRTGDDVLALGIVDLVGRKLRYRSEGATMTRINLTFAFDYQQDTRAKRYIEFPPGIREVVITPQNVGLARYALAENLRVAREHFDTLSSFKKKGLLSAEVSRRLDLFVRTFDRAKHDSWSLSSWAKVEWMADALDGNAPFDGLERGEPMFEDRSFKWLLASLAHVAGGGESRRVDKAITGTNRLFELLTAVGPESNESDVSRIIDLEVERVIDEFSLGPWRAERSSHR